MSDDSLYLLEQTDFSLRLARCAGRRHPVRIEDAREVPIGDSDALAEAVVAAVSSGAVTSPSATVAAQAAAIA